MSRFSLVSLGLIGAVVAAAVSADEPKTSAGPASGIGPAIDPNDPLYRALLEIQRDVDAMRSELGGRSVATPSPKQSPAPSSAPQMSPQPRGVTASSAASAPQAPIAAAAPAERSDHWSFQPVRRPALPAVTGASRALTAIDRFIVAKLEASGMHPNAEADAHALCRRLYFDLTGLPPTPAEVDAFVAAMVGDEALRDAAVARLVDQLLASPRFGERWARHWLDVVHYADSVGRSWNAPFTYAWRYRDYVIDAFNADVPYDRFIAEQLAGDLLTSDDIEERRAQLTACGMLGLGSLDLRGDTFQMDQIDDQIDVTTRAFLGLTISCARCHDHKYDPVTMHDYYALAGIFMSSDTLPGQADRFHLGGNGYVDPDRLVLLPSRPGETSPAGGIHSMSDYQAAWSKDRNVRFTTDPNLAMGVVEGEAVDCELRIRGEAFDRGPPIPRGDVNIPSLPRLPPIPPGTSGRLELARWIGSPENPLTARVMANRVWKHLFGRGLVRTVDDFGTTGEPPTHPELLDFLAAEFIEPAAGKPWSVKQLIRTIVLSRTYRLTSTPDKANDQIDPQNAQFWRSNLRHLELEPLRDAMMFVSGRLSVERPNRITVTGIGGKQGTKSLLGFDDPYRTIYLPVVRSNVPDIYGTFDFPDPTQIRGERDVTTVAPQALFLMNDRFAIECAESIADSVLRETPDDAERVRRSYLRLFGRPPTGDEIAAADSLIDGLTPDADHRDPELYRWSTLIQAMLAGAEFRYVR